MKTDIATTKGKSTKKELSKKIQNLIKFANERNHIKSQLALGKIYLDGTEVDYDYKAALMWLEKAEKQDDTGEAQHLLGLLYAKEKGLLINDKSLANDKDPLVSELLDNALNALKKASDIGSTDAMYDLAEILLGEKKYGEAEKLLENAVARGHAKAQRTLGEMYYFGNGVEVDYAKSLTLLNEAVKSGDLKAMYRIGHDCYVGKAVRKSNKLAKEWLIKAANKDDVESLHMLGIIALEEKEDIVAEEWFIKAANKEYAESQYLLGKIYLEKNVYDKARSYLEQASEQKHADASYTLGMMHLEGMGVVSNPTIAREFFQTAALKKHTAAEYMYHKDDIAKCYKSDGWIINALFSVRDYFNADNTAKKCLDKAIDTLTYIANKNHSDAQYTLGNLYYDDNYIEKNYTTAISWFTKASVHGHTNATYSLGEMYFKGDCTTGQNYTAALDFFVKAAEHGHARAQSMAGKIYFNGYGVTQDFTIAKQWFVKSAASGDSEAQYGLGLMHFEGKGLKQDFEAALKLFTQSSEQGHSDAYYKRGLMYFEGHGITKDYAEAKDCFEKAGDKHDDAQFMLISNSDILGYELDDL